MQHAPPPHDTLTFLASADTLGAKTWTPAGCSDYNAPVGPFAVTRVEITSLADLADALAICPYNAFHIRGSTIQPLVESVPYRRSKEHCNPITGEPEPPTLCSAQHRAIPVDFDDGRKDAPHMTDLYEAAVQARAMLPWPLNTAAAIAMATSSSGIRPGIRCRLWFWADRFTTDQEIKAWLSGTPHVDGKIYNAYQPIYCAAPRFFGVDDPFPRRMVVLPGPDLELPADLQPPVPNSHLPRAAAANAVLLGNAGQRTGSDTTQALAQALASNPLRLTEGNRNNALTSIAGSMRSRGASANEILAALRVRNEEQITEAARLPDQDLSTIAHSVARYEPSAVLVTVPKDDLSAARDSKTQCKRVQEDPELLPQALAVLRKHVDSGALTENQVISRLQAALSAVNVAASTDELRKALRAAHAPADTSQALWQTDLIRGADGSIAVGPFNLHTILRKHPEFSLWYDTRADEVQWQSCPWAPQTRRSMIDADASRLREWFDLKMGWRKMPEDPWEALRMVAQDTPWDPWRQGYLDALVWDQRPRLVHAATALLGCTTPRESMCFAWWMISLVARAYRPGCQVDYLIVLEGEQGVGKSSFLQELVTHPRYYSRIATSGDLNNPRVTGKLQGPVVIELAELSALTKRDISATKEFIDNREDKWQPLYSRTLRTSPRQIGFAGTTNDDDYLNDATGGRRFWPMKVGRIDLASLRVHRDQMWAEAVAMFRAGHAWHPTAEQGVALGLTEAQEERRQSEIGEDAFQELIAQVRVAGMSVNGQPAAEVWMLDEGRVVRATSEWIRAALGLHHKDVRGLARTLRAAGWACAISSRARGQRKRVWHAPGHAE